MGPTEFSIARFYDTTNNEYTLFTQSAYQNLLQNSKKNIT